MVEIILVASGSCLAYILGRGIYESVRFSRLSHQIDSYLDDEASQAIRDYFSEPRQFPIKLSAQEVSEEDINKLIPLFKEIDRGTVPLPQILDDNKYNKLLELEIMLKRAHKLEERLG